MGKQPEYKKNKLIDAAATYHENRVCLTVVNKSEKESLTISIPNYKKIIGDYLVNGNSPSDMNDNKNLEKVKIKTNKLKFAANSIKVPPHSLSLILLEI